MKDMLMFCRFIVFNDQTKKLSTISNYMISLSNDIFEGFLKPVSLENEIDVWKLIEKTVDT